MHCGVGQFTRLLQETIDKLEPGAGTALTLTQTEGRIGEIWRAVGSADSVVCNLPILAWKLVIARPLLALLFARLRGRKVILIQHEWRRSQRTPADCRSLLRQRSRADRPMAQLSIPAIIAAASILLSVAARACPALIEGVPADRITALSRGVNADGWIVDPRSAPPRGLLLELRKAGLTHIRLPVPADFVMPRFATKAEIDSRLQTVDAALKILLALGYAVSIDLHSGQHFNALHKDDPPGAMAEMKSAWTALARVMQRYPSDRVFAELLNEPEVDAAQWQGEVRELASFIRQLLPQTTLITGPVNWQRADSLPGFAPLDDPNVVYAIHFYDPMVFTHQAHWDRSEPLHDVVGLPYPIRADDPKVQQLREQLTALDRPKALAMVDRAIPDRGIDKWLEPAAAWQRQYSRPIIINEFGVLKAGAPRDSRLRWLAGVTAYARQQCWGWTHWELSQGFGLADAVTGKADRDVLRALLGTR